MKGKSPMHYRAFPAVRKDRKQHEEKPNSGNNRSAGSSGIPVCGRQAKVKAADAAYVSGTADVRIIQTEASYSSGAEAAVSFSQKKPIWTECWTSRVHGHVI